ncbi:MAG: tryptophan synthase subunit alpha [Chloroflexi bacterium]|nr:tryptophan synthase subunit alpha [Chloroflexota bacterium]
MESLFAATRADDRAVLIGYLPAGFPDPITFADMARLAATSGIDIMEIGVPADEPSCDGKIIREALESVRLSGIDVGRALDLAGSVRLSGDIPVIAMSYWATVFRYGIDPFLRRCLEAKVDGILIPDLPLEWTGEVCGRLQHQNLAMAAFIASPAHADLLLELGQCSFAFVYLRSSQQTTGEDIDLSTALRSLSQVRHALARRPLPVAVGFGIQTAEEVATLADAGADGVVVGTALVQACLNGPEAVAGLVRSLSAATRRRG